MEKRKYIIAKVDVPVLNIHKEDVLDYEIMKKKYDFVNWHHLDTFKLFDDKYSDIRKSIIKISSTCNFIVVGSIAGWEGSADEYNHSHAIVDEEKIKQYINDRFYRVEGYVYDPNLKRIFYQVVGSDNNRTLYVEERYMTPYTVKYVINKKGEIWEKSKENYDKFTAELGNSYNSREEAEEALKLICFINEFNSKPWGHGKILSIENLRNVAEYIRSLEK